MINPLLPLQNQESIENFTKMMDQIIHENELALKKIFSKEIKESFLITILKKVKMSYPDILKNYPNAFNLNPVNFMAGNDDKIDYDICCHIVGIHKFNMLFLRDDERGSFQNDSKYQDKLVNQVIEHIKLRSYGSSFFRMKPIMSGDRFLYFPIGYDMFVITSYMYLLLDNPDIKGHKLFHFFHSILNESISALTLIENGLLIQAYPQIRNLIELYFKYEVLFDKPEGLKEYYKFCDYEINYNSYNEFDDEFKAKFEPHREEASITEYLHYGWIDSIFNFNYLEKEKKYSLPGLYNYLKMIHSKKSNIDDLKLLHNICHAFSHGSTISKAYLLQSFFELIPGLYNVLRAILIDMCNIMKQDVIINGINIRKKMESDWDILCEKSKIMTMDKVKLYYGIK